MSNKFYPNEPLGLFKEGRLMILTPLHIMVDIIKVSFNYQLTEIFIRLKTFPMRIKNIENKYLTWIQV